MEIREISLWKKFKCQGSKCPDTCCRGWIIPLTKQDRIRFITSGGLTRFKLIFAMLGHRPGDFNSSCRVCPFLNKDKLCKLQLEHGHDFIPETCRSYPRSYRNYGLFEERFVDLSCIHTAALFVKHHKEIALISEEGEAESDLYSTNDDTDYLNDLVSSRTDMINTLSAVQTYDELTEVLTSIDLYAARIQDAFIHGENDCLKAVPFSDFYRDNKDSRSPEEKKDVFPLTASAVNYLMNTGLASDYLKYTNPYLYEIFSLYTKDPAGTYTPQRVHSIQQAYTEAFGENVSIYASYYAYYLYKFYLNCYEDYSFLKNVRMGLIHLGMVEFLHAVYYEKKGTLPVDEFTHILSAYNKRAYFNYENLDDMYEVFIADFF